MDKIIIFILSNYQLKIPDVYSREQNKSNAFLNFNNYYFFK